MIRGSFSHQLKAYIRQGYAPPEAMRLSWIDVRAGKVSPPPRPGRARGPRRLSRKSVALMRRESNPLTRRETAEILNLARTGRKAARGHRRFGDPQALRLAAYLTGRAERGIEIASEYGTVRRRHSARLNPVSAGLHVTNLRKLVKRLGGSARWVGDSGVLRVQVRPGTTPFILSSDEAVEALNERLRSEQGNPVTPSKAREILRHGEVGGHPLTPAQRGMFGVRVGGGRLTRLRRSNPRGGIVAALALEARQLPLGDPASVARFADKLDDLVRRRVIGRRQYLRIVRGGSRAIRSWKNPYYAVVDRGGRPDELPLLGGVNRYESWPYSRRGDAERRALDFARANLDAGRKVGRVRVVYKRRDPMRRAPLTAQAVELVRKYYPREEFGNAPWRGVELYNRVLEIRAEKGNTGRYPRKRFFHRFKHRARMFGLPNGDLLITGR